MANVHEECLIQWLNIKQSHHPSCELCKTPFRMEYDRPFEAYEEINLMDGYFLVYPSWHILASCVLQILCTRLLQIPPDTAYIYAQLTYLSIYMSINSFLVFKQLHSRILYLRHAIDEGMYVALFLHVHVWILLFILYKLKSTQYLFMFLSMLNQCYLGIYPILHAKVIRKMNSERNRVLVG